MRNILIALRVTQKEKEIWKDESEREGKALSDWIRDRCNDSKNVQQTKSQEAPPPLENMEPSLTWENLKESNIPDATKLIKKKNPFKGVFGKRAE